MELDVCKTVKKSNLLNEVRNANASLVEYRLFCVYLAHLSLVSESNVVTFRLADYARIVGLDRPRQTDLKAQAKNIVGVTATLDNTDGGFSVYTLFSEFKLFQDDGEWMVSLECNSKIAPMIREQKGRFLRYKLYNTIYLKSYNQQRLYEILKQYERIGERTVTLEELRAYLSIGEDEYPLWYTFSRDVLMVAQKALKENTDIYFEYVPIKKGRKVDKIKFLIYKNHKFVDQLQLDGYTNNVSESDFDYEEGEITVRSDDFTDDMEQVGMFDDDEPRHKYENRHFEFLAEACNYEFNQTQMEILLSLDTVQSLSDISRSLEENQLKKHNYLSRKYNELNLAASKTKIEYRFAYLKSMIENDDV